MAQLNQYELIAKKNIANILAKLKDGKTLTGSDRNALENHKRNEEGLRPAQSDDATAKELGVKRMTVHRWKNQGAPFNGTNKQLFEWMAQNNIRGAVEWKKAQNPASNTKPKKKTKRGGKSKTAEDLRDDYFAELQEAKRDSDLEREKLSLTAYLKIDKQIRETALDEKKLGIDKGEMLAREDVERILKNMFWAGNALCHKFSQQLAQRLSNKEAAEVYEILAPTLTALTIFEGMKRLSKTPGEINLPDWVVDCAKTEQQNYIEYK